VSDRDALSWWFALRQLVEREQQMRHWASQDGDYALGKVLKWMLQIESAEWTFDDVQRMPHWPYKPLSEGKDKP
jgi:hypothetical protein